MFGIISKYSLLYKIHLMLSIKFTIHSLYTVGGCTISGYRIICKHGDLPTEIPFDVRELYIEGFDLNKLFYGSPFENVSIIQRLDIQASKGHYIPTGSFRSLSDLNFLGIHGEELRHIDRTAFTGLENVRALDLSSNPMLSISEIRKALDNSIATGHNGKILPNLQYLSISGWKTVSQGRFDFNETFFRSLASGNRQLRTLEASNLTIIGLNLVSMRPLCRTVEYLDTRGIFFMTADGFYNLEPCKSLKMLDVSGITVPMSRIKLSFQAIQFTCESVRFFSEIEDLFLNNVNIGYDVEINNYVLNLSNCPLFFRNISAAGNKFKWINFTVLLHETTKKSLSEIHLPFNGLEYLSPATLMPSVNVQVLDLSNNKLYVMQEKYADDFEILFSAQTKLLYLNLSHNILSEIPMQTFLKNIRLKVLDISYNNLKSLDFSLKQLINLEKLIVSQNAIHTIETNVRVALESLLPLKYPVNGVYKMSFHVYLSGISFRCSCDQVDMQLLEWLYSTDVIDQRERIACSLAGNDVDVRGDAIDETEYFCRLQTFKKLSIIATPLVAIAVSLSVVLFLIIRKHRLSKQKVRSVIEQIERGMFPLPYLVFLSYCSEDTELVLGNIHPQLSKKLSEISHSKLPLVCVGDQHFRPGFALRYEVIRCMEESSVFVAIISRNFCRKTWCNLELGEAYDQNKPIIMLMTEHVEREMMSPFLQKIFDRYAHAKWKQDQNGGRIEPEWETFCKSIMQLAENWKRFFESYRTECFEKEIRLQIKY